MTASNVSTNGVKKVHFAPSTYKDTLVNGKTNVKWTQQL